MSPLDNGSAFGHRSDEHVFDVTQRRSPSTRIRVASPSAQGKLRFEPEGESQDGIIKAALAPGPVPQSSLAFEPDEGEILDRVSQRDQARAAGGAPKGEDLAALVKLAASSDESVQPRPPKRPGASGPTDLAGDLEAEMFGPRKSAHLPAGPARADASARPREPKGETEAMRTQVAVETGKEGGEVPTGARTWISVFLSDKVAGRRRRRPSTILFGNRAIVGTAAGRLVIAPYVLARRVAERVDAVTRRYRLPLANIAWGVLISALAVALGVTPVLGLVFFGVCLVLTVAGQPACNLLGFAGIIISSAAIAEIIRQRERFLEIFLNLFS